MFILNSIGRRKADALNEVLSAYTDALLDDDRGASQVLEQHPDEVSTLEDLLSVSYQLHEMLGAVRPRQRFVSDLKTELQKSQTTLAAERAERRRRHSAHVTNTIGTVLSILAITALLTRVISAIIMLMTLRSRRRRSAATV